MKDSLQRLMTSAREEFSEKGFQQAALRNICKKAGLTTGAVYFFFDSKEDLFEHLVGEAASQADKMLRLLTKEIDLQEDDLGKYDQECTDYIFEHRQEYYLLLEKSEGTRYAKFKEDTEKQLGNLFRKRLEMRYGDCLNHIIDSLVHIRIFLTMDMVNESENYETFREKEDLIKVFAEGGFEKVVETQKEKASI